MAAEDVLLIDKNEHDRCFVASILEEGGFAVREADNGVVALARMRSRRPSVVILDLHLPNDSSYDLLIRLKKDPAFQQIPVLGISSPLSAREEEKALQYGCAAYFPKPIDAEQMIARLQVEVSGCRAG